MADILTDEQVKDCEWSIKACGSLNEDDGLDLIATLRHVQAENERLHRVLRKVQFESSVDSAGRTLRTINTLVNEALADSDAKPEKERQALEGWI